MERTGLSFGEWRREVERIVANKISAMLLHMLLDREGLKKDYEAGLSPEKAAEARIKDASSLNV